MTRRVKSRIDRFAGLSDRQHPVQQTRIESPDLLNVEFSEGAMEKRAGWQRMHASAMRDSAARLNGSDQYLKIGNLLSPATYAPTNNLFLTVDVVLRGGPDPSGASSERWVLSRGYGTGANRYLSISYDFANNQWKLLARDGASDRSVTVADAVNSLPPTDLFRHHEVTLSSGVSYSWKVYDSSGAQIGSTATFDVTTWLADGSLGSATGWVLGADQGSTGAPVASSYLSATLAEFRIWDSSSTPSYFSATAATRVARELDNGPDSTEYTGLTGYWKLNDGKGNTISDGSSNGNDGVIGGEAPAWVSDSALAPGPSALEFFGEQGAVLWASGAVATQMWGDISSGALVDRRRWGATLVFVPRMDTGEATVRDQTLVWFGTNATTPAPFAVVVSSDQIVVKYQDGSGVQSVTIGVNLSTKVNTRLRLIVSHDDDSGGDTLHARLRDDAGTLTWGTSASTDGANAASFSAHCSVGRKFSNSNYTIPHTWHDNAARCVISDLVFWRIVTETAGPGFNAPWDTSTQAANQFLQSTALAPTHMMGALPLDDGEGITPRVRGTVSGQTAYILPDEEGGVRWDLGIVDPYDPPSIDGIFDYRRQTNDGSLKRAKLVVSGTTLYEVTGLDNGVGAATAKAVAGNIHKGGICTFSQLQDVVYIGRPNGKRPRKWDGSNLDWVGIRAPQQATATTTKSAAGSFSGVYQMYVTYRNKETGVESNPSPPESVDLSSNDTIDSINVPVSTDPQVNQRRVWMTVAGAAAGTTLYLVVTIEDNVTKTYTTDVSGDVSTSATALTDYTAKTEAPTGGLVKTFKDRLWVAGSPLYPNRAWYSNVLAANTFGGTSYLDLDQDTGDRITTIGRLLNRLAVFSRDGMGQMTESGDSNAPFFWSLASRDSGAVGPQGATEYEGVIAYLGERDVFLWDGSQTLNLSSPNSGDRPSVQTLVRTGLQDSLTKNASLAVHRGRGQLWIAVTASGSTSNDTVLVFDLEGGVWSKYEMDVDVLAEIEDEADTPWIYGGIHGFLCKMDSGDFDGPASATSGTATSGTTATLVDSGASWTVDAFKGMYVHWYDTSNDVARSARIRKNTSTTISFYDAASVAPASGDSYLVGGIPWYAEFVHDFGNPLRMKKIMWHRVSGESDSDSNRLRLTIKEDSPGRDSTWNASGVTEYDKAWAATAKYHLQSVGRVGRSYRLRVGDTGVSSPASTGAFPQAGKLTIFEMELDGEELDVQ